jgi:hypothetical protein
MPPFGGPLEVLPRDRGQRIAFCHDVAAGVVGRLQVELEDLLGQRPVLLERDSERGAQRRALRAEEREVLLDPGHPALELGTPLALVHQAVAGEAGSPDERADRRDVRVDLDQPVELYR